MTMCCSKLIQVFLRELIKIFSRSLQMLMNIFETGRTMSLCGLLTPEKSSKSWEKISINGKVCSMKSDRIEKLLITVRLKNLLDLLLLTIDWFSTKLRQSMILGIRKFWVISVINLEKL